jgi:hypothetical protein
VSPDIFGEHSDERCNQHRQQSPAKVSPIDFIHTSSVRLKIGGIRAGATTCNAATASGIGNDQNMYEITF